MLPRFFVCIASILFCKLSQAQLPPLEAVTIRDLGMKNCPFDSSAGAMVIFDRGSVRVYQAGTTKITRQLRIKFFSKESIDEWSSHSFILDRGEQSLTRLKGTTYNLDGDNITITPLVDEAVFKKRFDKYRKEISFTLSNVREGSIIDIEYVFVEAGVIIPNWQFQGTLPKQESRYEVYTPRELEYITELQGVLPIGVHNVVETQSMAYWVMYRVPALKEEPYMASIEDFTSTLQFYPKRTRGAWGDILNDLNTKEDFGDFIYYVYDDELAQATRRILKGLSGDSEKFQAIVNHIKSNVVWNGDIDKFGEQLPRQTLRKKIGSTADINLLLLVLLREANIKAAPVLISTRGNGLPNLNRPSTSHFNDVIVQVTLNENKYLVDATDKHLNALVLPERCMNAAGFVVYRDSAKWVPITTNKSREIVDAKLTLQEDGSITGSVTVTMDGHKASDIRKEFIKQGKEGFLTQLAQTVQAEIVELEVKNLDTANEPFKLKYQIKKPGHGQLANSLMYVDPIIQNRIAENPFKASERKYPIDFPSIFDRYFVAQIQIPDNFEIDEIPKMATISLADNGGRFLYSVTVNDKSISVICRISLDKRVFSNREYIHLKEYYTQLIAKQSELIVLRKKA